MTKTQNRPHVLLVMDRNGSTTAIRFPNIAAARDWEDANEDRVEVVGCVPVVSATEALT